MTTHRATCDRCGAQKERRAVSGGVGDGREAVNNGSVYICPNTDCFGDISGA